MSATVSLLNGQQAQVAENFCDNFLLLAGAGTGKTSTLACRVAALLESGTAKPEETLCLTFTNRACRELSERIVRIVGDDAGDVLVRTLHSFCAWLLRHTPQKQTDIGRDFTVCDQPDCLEVIREVVFEVTGRAIADSPAAILQNFIGLVKDCQLAFPENDAASAAAYAFTHCRQKLEALCIDDQRRFDPKFFAFLAKYGASIVRLYNAKLVSNNLLDFSDLLLRANAVLSDPETAVLWRKRFRYVHVDEAQDVSAAEYSLIEKLCENATLLLCGDFNQTIYQWRGSDPDTLMRRFQTTFHPVLVEFTENYRSSGQLLDTAKNFLRNAFGKGPGSQFDPVSPESRDVVFRQFDTPPDEIHWIYQQIASLDVENYSRVAVITRTNKACTQVCDLLAASRPAGEPPIRFLLSDEFRLFKRAEVKDLLACAVLISNPRDGESLKRVLTRLVRGVGDATVSAIIRQYRDGLGVSLTDFVDARTRCGDFFGPLLAALEAGNVVVYDVESTGTDVYTDDIVQMAAVRLGPDGAVSQRFERFLRPEKPVGDSEKVHGFSDAFLAECGGDPAEALGDFLTFIDGAVLVGHNLGFDMAITAQNLARRGIMRPLDCPWYDTLDLSRRFLKNLENHKLSTVAAALGAENDPSHDAMDDILATADVLNLLVRKFLLPGETARRACYAKYLPKLEAFSQQLNKLRTAAGAMGVPELLHLLSEECGVAALYAQDPARLANLALVLDFAQEFTRPEDPPARQLSLFLELTALSAGDLDRMSGHTDKVAVITAHQAKGCEFDYVFLPVLQEGVFPTYQAVKSGDVEEEKRVFYVSLTRAKKRLYLSCARYDQQQRSQKPSRFLELLGPAPL